MYTAPGASRPAAAAAAKVARCQWPSALSWLRSLRLSLSPFPYALLLFMRHAFCRTRAKDETFFQLAGTTTTTKTTTTTSTSPLRSCVKRKLNAQFRRQEFWVATPSPPHTHTHHAVPASILACRLPVDVVVIGSKTAAYQAPGSRRFWQTNWQ